MLNLIRRPGTKSFCWRKVEDHWEFWSILRGYWFRSVGICVDPKFQFPNDKIVSYEDTWCEPTKEIME